MHPDYINIFEKSKIPSLKNQTTLSHYKKNPITGKYDGISAETNYSKKWNKNTSSDNSGNINYAAALNAASGLFDFGAQAFEKNLGNEYMDYGSSWSDIINNQSKLQDAMSGIRSNTMNFSDINNMSGIYNAYNSNQLQKNVMQPNSGDVAGSIGMDTLSDAAKYAAIGTEIMPGWGTLAGAIVGTITGATRGSVAAAQNKRNRFSLNNTVDRANYTSINNRDNQIGTIQKRNTRTALMKNPFGNTGRMGAFGGYLFQNGGMMDQYGQVDPTMVQMQPQYGDNGNGVTTFNNGGMHEENPYGGIPQGVAPDGETNYVEEGEVKYDDYIFSDRLKATKSLLKEYLLPTKYAGKSFAYIAEKLQKDSEENPNDEISKSTLDTMMGRLQEAQEEYKYQKEIKEKASEIDNLSDEEKASLLDDIQQPQMEGNYGMQEQQQVDPMMAQQMMQQNPYAEQQVPMSPEEQAMMEQQMAQQGGQPYACGGRKLQDGGPTMLEKDYYPSPTFKDQIAKMVNGYYDYLIRHNPDAPEGTRFAGMSAYAPFYDQYDDIESRMPVKKPIIESTSYAYEQPQWSIDLNNVVNAYKTKKSQDAFYDRWIGFGKDKDGNYWYYRHHPEDKMREKPTLADVHANVADMGYGDSYIEYADGGSIHIKPSKKGTFTAAATKHGKSVQEFASQVLANKENYSPEMVKKANFAKNASKWHDFGGHLFAFGSKPEGITINPRVRNFKFWNKDTDWYDDGYYNWVKNLDLDNEYKDLYANLYKKNKNLTPAKVREYGIDGKGGDVTTELGNAYLTYLKKLGDEKQRQTETPTETSDVTNIQKETPTTSPVISPVTPPVNGVVIDDNNTFDYTKPTKWEGFFDTLAHIGPFTGPLVASFQKPDFRYANKVREYAGRFHNIGTPHVNYTANFNPIDSNLAMSNLQAQYSNAVSNIQNSNFNPAAKQALLANLNNTFQENALKTELAYRAQNQAALQALRDKEYDAAVQNASIDQHDAQANAQIDAMKTNMLTKAEEIKDKEREAWAKMMSDTWTNMFNQANPMKQQEFNNRMYQEYLRQQGVSNEIKQQDLAYKAQLERAVDALMKANNWTREDAIEYLTQGVNS